MLGHVAIALIIQVAVFKGLRTHGWAGAAAAICWAVAREITQAEYRWIERFGGGLRANMPWWGGFDPQVWHADAFLDVAVPTAAVLALAYVLRATKNRRRHSVTSRN